MANDNDLKIRVVWDDAQAQQGAAKTKKAVVDIDKEVKKNNVSLGMSRREWMRTGSEASYYLRTAIGESSALGKQLSNTVGFATQLGESFAFGGGVGVAVFAMATALGALSKVLFETSPEVQALNAELKKLAESNQTAETLAKISGVSVAQAQAALDAAKNNKEYAKELANLNAEATKTVGQGALDEIGRRMSIYGTILDYVATRAMPRTTAMLKSLNDTSADASVAQEKLNDSIRNVAPAIAEQNRLTTLYKPAIGAAASAIRDYNKQLGAMATAHAKSQRGFADDWTKAETKAARDVEKIRANSIERISDLERSAAERLFEMARVQAKADTEFQRDREQSEAEYIKARGELELDAAREIEKINSDLRDSLEQLNRDSLEEEIGASSWAEVQKIRRNAQRRRDELNQKANENKTEAQNKLTVAQQELAARKRERDDEANYNKQKRDEEYNYDRNKANQELNEARENARQEAQAAIEERNRQLGEERVAIQARRDEETAAYNQNRNDARIAHDERITQLFDTRTEEQKLADGWLVIRDNTDIARLAVLDYNAAMRAVSPSSQSSFQSGYRPKGWYAEGGDFVVNRPTVIGVGERGAERVTVTPLTGNNRGNAGGRGDVVINIGGNVYGVGDLRATIMRALDQYDKGLM